jgi:hypothetical protein
MNGKLVFCQWLFGDLKRQKQNTLAVSLGINLLTIEGLTLHY